MTRSPHRPSYPSMLAVRSSGPARASRLTTHAPRAEQCAPAYDSREATCEVLPSGLSVSWFVGFVGAAALAIAAGSSFTVPIVAQSVLAQFGLTEASARSLLFEEMKSQRGGHRRGAIEVAGHRAFYKLPPAARGPAATALFAWAKAYVNSPGFKTAYAQFRKDAGPVDERPGPSADAQAAEMKANQDMVRQIAEKLPPAERDKLLAQMKEQEQQWAETRARIQKTVEAGQAEQKAQDKVRADEFEAMFPPIRTGSSRVVSVAFSTRPRTPTSRRASFV